MNKKVLIIFSGIIILAAVLRLWNIGKVPLSPDWDEVSLGYNAYSILHTGADEYHQFLPVVLKSFGDYKPALYAYLIIPFLFLFNLSVIAIRLPSALFGILTVAAIYLLVKELFGGSQFKIHSAQADSNSSEKKDSGQARMVERKWIEYIALASAFFLAISPWHIQFSRVGFEANVGLALNVFLVLFFLKGLKKPWFLGLSAICAALSLYAYQSEKIFTPLFVLILIILYRKPLFSLPKKYIGSAFVLGLIFILPLIFYTISVPASLGRASSTSVFAAGNQLLQKDIQKLQFDKKTGDSIGLILDNRRVVFAKQILANYLSHFDFNWLFIHGDIDRHHAPGMGLIYLAELPFVLIGIYELVFLKRKNGYGNLSKIVIFSFLFLGPLPTAFTQDAPHAVRSLNMLPFFPIASGIGAVTAYFFIKTHVKSQFYCTAIFTGVVALFAFNFIYYLDQYFIQQNYFNAKDWQYGYEQTVADVSKIQGNYKNIIVDNVTPMDQSYIFFLFYLKYPPVKYQMISSNYEGDKKTFDNFQFRPIDWYSDKNLQNTLLIGTQQDFPSSITPLEEVKYPNGTTAIELVETGK